MLVKNPKFLNKLLLIFFIYTFLGLHVTVCKKGFFFNEKSAQTDLSKEIWVFNLKRAQISFQRNSRFDLFFFFFFMFFYLN